MKRAIITALFPTVVHAQAWIFRPDFPGSKRDDGVGVTLNNTAFFGTGLQEGWSATADFYAFNFTSNSWSAIPSMPAGAQRQYACAFPYADGFFVFGGDAGGALNSLYRYSISAASWSLMAAKPGQGMKGATAFAFGERVTVCCGQALGNADGEVWEYDIGANSWKRKNDVSFTPRWRCAGAVFEGEGYLTGGWDNAGGFRKEIYKYDPALDQWKPAGTFTMSAARVYTAFQRLGEKLALFGGLDSLNACSAETWFYDPLSGLWQEGPDLPSSGRKGGMSAAWYGTMMYTCGYNNTDGRLKETWLLNTPLAVRENTFDATSYSPNPCNDRLELRCLNAGDVIRIMTADGKNVLNTVANQRDRSLDVSAFPPGLYFISSSAQGATPRWFKLVKE